MPKRKTVKRIVKKRPTKKPVRRNTKKKNAKIARDVSLEKIGEVTHYFPQVKAAAVKILKDSIKVGDKICIKGHTTDFKEKIKSMQLDRVRIEKGAKGDEIGLLVKSRVRIGDSVYRL